MTYLPGETNPIWLDLGPIAPMEDGLPMKVANSVALNHEGWLVGDYAASATDYNYQGHRKTIGGCDTLGEKAYLTCMKAGLILGRVHVDKYRPYFESGLAAMKRDPRFVNPQTGDHAYLDGLSWEGYQRSDGLADFGLAMTACKKGGSAVKSCTAFKAINHSATAGGSHVFVRDLIEQLSH